MKKRMKKRMKKIQLLGTLTSNPKDDSQPMTQFILWEIETNGKRGKMLHEMRVFFVKNKGWCEDYNIRATPEIAAEVREYFTDAPTSYAGFQQPENDNENIEIVATEIANDELIAAS